MRYVLLDRITELSPPELARGLKAVSLSDDVFADHFPGHPIMPGALILEALAQLGGVLLEATARERDADAAGTHALLVGVDRARFRRVVRPGDRLELEAVGLHCTEDGGQVRGRALRDGELAAEAELTFAFARADAPKQIERRMEILNVWLHGSSEPE